MKHVVFAIGSLYGGGAERVVSLWSSALAERGYKVSVIVYSRMDDEYAINEKVNVYPVASSQQSCNEMSIFKRTLAYRKILKRISPDVIISFLPNIQIYIRFASLGLRIKKIETLRSNPLETNIMKTKFARSWMKCYKKARAVILQTEGQKIFFSVDVKKKSVVIPNPVNNDFVNNFKKNYNSKSHKIVATGRLSWQKNYKMMIDVIKIISQKHQDVTLEIYGVGPQEEELKKYIQDKGLDKYVRLMGRTNDLIRIYKESDVYLLSSLCEGMPNALVEAMAMGLPCVSTDCKTGPSDLIDDGVNGFLVECNDVDAMANKVLQIFNMTDEEQRTFGENARKKIIDFCGEKNSIDKLINLIESI